MSPLVTKRVFFFFFQAEDGIRDLYVTGVQTCALPISGTARDGIPPPLSGSGASRVHNTAPCGSGSPAATPRVNGSRPSRGRGPAVASPGRSEERRVGKECSARRSGYQGKNREDSI